MAQNSKVNPYCSYPANPYHECTETCLREAPPQKNKKSSDHGYPSKVRASSRSEKKKLETETNEHNVSFEAVSMEKHIQDVMDFEDNWYARSSPVHIIFCLCFFTGLVAIDVILLGMNFPSQQSWLLPTAAFLVFLLIIFNILFYMARLRYPALTPMPPIPSMPPVPSMPLSPSSRPSPPLSMPAA